MVHRVGHTSFYKTISIYFLLVCCIFSFLTCPIANGLPSSEKTSVKTNIYALKSHPKEIIIKFDSKITCCIENGFVVTHFNRLDSLFKIFKIDYFRKLFPSKFIHDEKPHSKVKKRLDNLSNVYRLSLSDPHDVNKLLILLQKEPTVIYAEPNYFYYSNTSSETPSFFKQSILEKIQIDHNLELAQNDSLIIIGIIDTGIEWDNSAISNMIWHNNKEIRANSTDYDGNGFIDDCHDWDFVSVDSIYTAEGEEPGPPDSDPSDYAGHGTFLARIITNTIHQALSNSTNNLKARLLPLRAGFKSSAQVNLFKADDCAEAIYYAVEKRAAIIHLGWGGPQFSYLLQDVISYATDNHCIIIAAAGNENSSEPHYPAAYASVWAVAATDQNDRKEAFSNYGPWITISAPGRAALTSLKSGNKNNTGGTSVASSIVTGLATLMLAKEPNAPPDTLRKRLVCSAENIDSVNPDYDGLLGAGRINAWRALNNIRQSNLILRSVKIRDIEGNANQRLDPGETVELILTLQNIAHDAQGVWLKLKIDDPYITYTNSSQTLGPIAYLDSIDNFSDPFILKVETDCPETHTVNCSLHLSDHVSFEKSMTIPLTIGMPAPIGLSAIDTQDGQTILLHWQYSQTEKIKGFDIYRKSLESGEFEKINETIVSSTSFIDRTVQPTNTWIYSIRAVNMEEKYSGFSIPDTVMCTFHEKLKFIDCQFAYDFAVASIFTAGDFDNDKNIDIVLTKWDSFSSLLLKCVLLFGDGKGGFEQIELGTFLPTDIKAGDIDRDGKLDLVVLDASSNIFFLMNEGQRLFRRAEFKNQVPTQAEQIELIDADLDGDLDIFVNHSHLILFEHISELNFVRNHLAVSFQTPSFRCQDLNGDAYPDIIYETTNEAGIGIALNHGDGHFTSNNSNIQAGNIEYMALFDCTSDSVPDLISIQSTFERARYIIFYKNDGKAYFNEARNIPIPKATHLTPGDVDSDGDLDFIVENAASSNGLFLNDGLGHFQISEWLAGEMNSNSGILLDVDHDGDLDYFEINNLQQPPRLFFNNQSPALEEPDLVPPEKLQVSLDLKKIKLCWQTSVGNSSEETQAKRFWQLRVGTMPGGYDIVSPVHSFSPENRLSLQFTYLTKLEPEIDYYWSVRAVDHLGRTSEWAEEQSFKLTNSAPNILRYYPSNDTTIFEGDTLIFSIEAVDPEADSIHIFWRTTSLPDSAKPGTQFVYAPGFKSARADTIQASVSDGDTTIAHYWFITINNVNRPPQIIAASPPGDTTIFEGESLTLLISAFDLDSDSLSYRWFVNDIADTNQLDSSYIFLSDLSSAGVDTVLVEISDTDTSITTIWYVTIQNLNQSPKIIDTWPTSKVTAIEGDTVLFEAHIQKPDSQRVKVLWFVNGVHDTTGTDTSLQLIAELHSGRIDSITVVALDADSMIWHDWFLKVNRFNHLPEILAYNPQNDTSLSEGESLIFTIHANDIDSDSLSFKWSISGLIDSTEIDSQFILNTDNNSAGIDTVRAWISDGDTSIFKQWIVMVSNLNNIPEPPEVIYPIKGETVSETNALSWIAAFDPDIEDSTLTYLLEVALDSSFQRIVSKDTSLKNLAILLSQLAGFDSLQPGKQYYWRVKAIDSHGDSSRFSKISVPFIFNSLLVKLSNRYAQINENGSITIYWETEFERDILGFNIYRAISQAGPFLQINQSLIRGNGSYSFLDTDIKAGVTYYYELEGITATGTSMRHSLVSIETPVPEKFELYQNYPNPFNVDTVIRYQIPRECYVLLTVHNILGRVVKTLVDENQKAGFYNAYWNGRDNQNKDVGSGIYFYNIYADKFHQTRKLIVVR